MDSSTFNYFSHKKGRPKGVKGPIIGHLYWSIGLMRASVQSVGHRAAHMVPVGAQGANWGALWPRRFLGVPKICLIVECNCNCNVTTFVTGVVESSALLQKPHVIVIVMCYI